MLAKWHLSFVIVVENHQLLKLEGLKKNLLECVNYLRTYVRAQQHFSLENENNVLNIGLNYDRL